MALSNKISTLWVEGEIRNIDHVCLKSMVANNMDVTLYTYGEVTNVPKGVKIADGNEILDLSLIDRLQTIKKAHLNKKQSIQSFSDIFRIFLMKYEKGLWLDTDVFLFRHFEYDTNDVYFNFENNIRIGASVYYLPKGHPIIKEYEDLILQEELIPNWLGFRRGWLRPTFWRLTGQKFSPTDLGITLYGNDAFTRLAKRHNCYTKAGPKAQFYYWTGKKTDRLFERSSDYKILLDNPKYIGLHIHRKHMDKEPIQPGSFWAWAADKYGLSD